MQAQKLLPQYPSPSFGLFTRTKCLASGNSDRDKWPSGSTGVSVIALEGVLRSPTAAHPCTCLEIYNLLMY